MALARTASLKELLPFRVKLSAGFGTKVES